MLNWNWFVWLMMWLFMMGSSLIAAGITWRVLRRKTGKGDWVARQKMRE